MPLNPAQTVYERVEFIQRDVFADLPALNTGGSPKLGTICRLNNGEKYQVVVDDTSPTGTLVWEQVGGGGGVSAPDQRFTVAPATYALDTPGTNTFVTPEAGVAAAVAGTGTTLPPPSVASQRFVWIHPSRYTAGDVPIALAPYVHLVGSAQAASAPELVGYTLPFTSGGYLVISGVRFSQCTFAFTPDAETSIVFVNCQFSQCTMAYTTPANAEASLRMLGCGGDLELTLDGVNQMHVEFSGTSTSISAFDGNPTGTAESTLTFTNGIALAGGVTAELVFKCGQRSTYTGPFWMTLDQGSTMLLTTKDSELQMPAVGSTSLISLVNNASATWTALAGSTVFGVPETIFDAAPGCGGTISTSELAFPLTNPLVTTEPANSVSGGTVTTEGLGDGACARFAAYIINVTPGDPVAAQTAVMMDGFADVLYVVANYPPGYALQPDTNSAARAFGSLLLIDPELMLQGRKITIVNDGNPAALQGAFALRLPNGTASRINQQQPDISVNPVYTTEDYIILYPGDSVELVVNQSFSSPTSYLVSAKALQTIEPGWLAEAMAQYQVLPGTLAGSNTTGTLFFARQAGVYCQGGRFYWGGVVARTIRVTLWGSISGSVATVDVAVPGAGLYEGRFATSQLINGFENWFITIWETTGAEYQNAAPITTFTLRYGPGIQMRNYPLHTCIQTASGAGNTIPTISPGANAYYLVEPIVSSNEV